MTAIATLTCINVARRTSTYAELSQHGRRIMNEDATTMKHIAVVVGCLVALTCGLMVAVTLIA